MYPANTHVIRLATEEDTGTLTRLAQVDSQRPLGGDVLIGEVDGKTAAAISLTDSRVISDPFQHTSQITQLLRMRAASINAVLKTPSLRERILGGVRRGSYSQPLAKAA
jgi:hypothetical protein